MKTLKRFLLTVTAGGLVGAVFCAWFSPYFIVPTDLGASCSPAVELAIGTYRKVIFSGVLMGSIAAGILFLALGRSRVDASAQTVLSKDSSAP